LLNPAGKGRVVGANLIALVRDLAATAHPAASNILLMVGDDHRWEDAPAVYDGLDAAIEWINNQSSAEAGSGAGVRAQYSTPSRFFTALHQEQLSFPSRSHNWDM